MPNVPTVPSDTPAAPDAPDAPSPALAISRPVRRFLDQPNYATLATIGEDGTPHQAVIWFRLDPDDRVLVNSRAPRRWPDELKRDGRCALAVTDSHDPYRWVALQCQVETVVDDVELARDDIVALAERYSEADEESIATFRTQARISFRLRILSIHDHLAS